MIRRIMILTGGLATLVSLCAYAMHPLPPKSLVERIRLASHVVIGVAKEMHILTITNGIPRRVEPLPTQLGLETSAEFAIEVQEVLFPTDFKPDGMVKYRFGGGCFDVESLRRDTVGKTNIYILSRYEDRDGPCFGTSYGWYLCEPLESKEEIRKLLKAREDAEHKRPNTRSAATR